MKTEEAARRFVRLFPEIYSRFHRRLHHSEYRLTGESFAVLQHLAHTGPLTVTEAAKHMGRSQAATSELIQRLIDRDLLARMQDQRDRRRMLIWLTDEGQTLLEDARKVLSEQLVERALGQLPPRRRGELIRCIEELLDTNPHAQGTENE